MLQKKTEMHEQSWLSGQFDSCLFLLYSILLINEGISATSYILNFLFYFVTFLPL